jgi:excisionase family DNA binding protein
VRYAMKRLLTVDELSDRLQVGKSTVYRWVQCDFVPYFKVGRVVRFDEEAVRSWLAKRTYGGKKLMAGSDE